MRADARTGSEVLPPPVILWACEAAYRVARRRLSAPTFACAVALRAEELARRGAWALGERCATLGERCACVCVCVCVCEARVVRRACRVAHRAVRWLRELDASAKRKRLQRSVAALQERWKRKALMARAERASAVPAAARAVVLMGALSARVSLGAWCGVVWCA